MEIHIKQMFIIKKDWRTTERPWRRLDEWGLIASRFSKKRRL